MIVMNAGGVRKAATGVLLGLSIFYFLVLQPSDVFQQRISELSMMTAGTDPRLISLRAGLNAILQSPLWGSGPASYESTAYRALGTGYPSVYYHAYNVFVYFTVEAGLKKDWTFDFVWCFRLS
jgi:O-antigen ligase